MLDIIFQQPEYILWRMAVAEFPFRYSAVGDLEESAKLPAVHPGLFAQFEDFVFAVHKVALIYVKHATQLF